MGRGKNVPCNICNNIFLDKGKNVTDWLKCDSCSNWYHAICCSINEDEYAVLVGNKKWFCPICIKESNFNHLSTKILTSINTQLQGADFKALIDAEFGKLWPTISDKVIEVIDKKVTPVLDNLHDRINELEKKIAYQDAANRSKNLILQGLPTVNSDDIASIIKIAQELKISSFSADWIDYVKRFSVHKPSSTPNILIRFSTLRYRNSFMAAYINYIKNRDNKLSLKCINPTYPDGSIYFNEHLSTSTFKLLMKARKLVRERNLWRASIYKNKVTIQLDRGGKPIIINSSLDLNSFDTNRCSTPAHSSQQRDVTSLSFHSTEENSVTLRDSKEFL